jgi:Fe2+/Zn2+ uptake regulation proteins
MDKDDKIREMVKERLTTYLTENKLRKTPERYAILDLIYTDPRHFDMETLYHAMNERNFRVSRATLYNTMQLLVKCKLVLQHQFGKNLSYYERAYNNDYHHHAICTICGKVQEQKDQELRNLAQKKKIRGFAPSHYAFYIYGTCSKCAKELKEQKAKKNNNN